MTESLDDINPTIHFQSDNLESSTNSCSHENLFNTNLGESQTHEVNETNRSYLNDSENETGEEGNRVSLQLSTVSSSSSCSSINSGSNLSGTMPSFSSESSGNSPRISPTNNNDSDNNLLNIPLNCGIAQISDLITATDNLNENDFLGSLPDLNIIDSQPIENVKSYVNSNEANKTPLSDYPIKSKSPSSSSTSTIVSVTTVTAIEAENEKPTTSKNCTNAKLLNNELRKSRKSKESDSSIVLETNDKETFIDLTKDNDDIVIINDISNEQNSRQKKVSTIVTARRERSKASKPNESGVQSSLVGQESSLLNDSSDNGELIVIHEIKRSSNNGTTTTTTTTSTNRNISTITNQNVRKRNLQLNDDRNKIEVLCRNLKSSAGIRTSISLRSSADADATIIIDDERNDDDSNETNNHMPISTASLNPLLYENIDSTSKRPRFTHNIINTNANNFNNIISNNATASLHNPFYLSNFHNEVQPSTSYSHSHNFMLNRPISSMQNQNNFPSVSSDAALAMHAPVQSNPSSTTTQTSIHCPICLETLDEVKQHNKRMMSTTCGHIFCHSCLDEHIKKTMSSMSKIILCPTCRSKLTKAKIHTLYI